MEGVEIMAIIKAVKFFEEQKAVLEKHLKNGGEFAKEALAATDTALEALRKRVPRALTEYNSTFEDGKCPSCGSFFENGDFCYVCGQSISKLLSECIKTQCDECVYDRCSRKKHSGAVCEHYADKVDEIIRIHNEGVKNND